jgi:hypothetical protein
VAWLQLRAERMKELRGYHKEWSGIKLSWLSCERLLLRNVQTSHVAGGGHIIVMQVPRLFQ